MGCNSFTRALFGLLALVQISCRMGAQSETGGFSEKQWLSQMADKLRTSSPTQAPTTSSHELFHTSSAPPPVLSSPPSPLPTVPPLFRVRIISKISPSNSTHGNTPRINQNQRSKKTCVEVLEKHCSSIENGQWMAPKRQGLDECMQCVGSINQVSCGSCICTSAPSPHWPLCVGKTKTGAV